MPCAVETRPGRDRLTAWTLWLQWALSFAVVLVVMPAEGAVQDQGTPAGSPLQSDAQLTDAFFLDAEHGWVVGDRGVILHTSDGGEHWRPQSPGVECRLESVYFLDQQRGWAAGGCCQPYSTISAAVLLHTRDGGEHWSCDRKLLLPGLRRIKFFDARRGCAIGQSSAMYSSAVFVTEDGGRSWSALPAAGNQGWTAGDFIDPFTGALAGRSGAVATIRRRNIELSSQTDFGIRGLHALKLTDGTNGWLVGDGLVLQTADLGRSWQTTAGDLPPGVRDHFDFTALEVCGRHVWVAGAPGTRIFYSPDGGETWSARATGENLPIRDLAFVDEQRGWAVGDLGQILATDDAGQTWHRQRGRATHAALMAFCSQSSEVPLELLAKLSGDDGYLGIVDVLDRQDLEPPSSVRSEQPTRTHEAVVRVGGSLVEQAWQFPARDARLGLSAEQIIEAWDRANDGRGRDRLSAYLVQQIRAWRPAIVFLPATDPRGDNVRTNLLHQLVLAAVEDAADATRYPDQIAQAGLSPVRVKKVYAALGNGEPGTANVNTALVCGRLGGSPADVAATARGLLEGRVAPSPPNMGFRLLVDHTGGESAERDFFSGIALGGEARRALNETAEAGLEEMKRNAQARRNLQAILAQAEERDASDGRLLAGLSEQTRAMDENNAAQLLFQLAERYHGRGRWDMAAECYDLIASRYPTHPLAGRSLVWLVQYYASSEAAWRAHQGHEITTQQVGLHPAAPTRRRPTQREAEVQPVSATTPAAQVLSGGGLLPECRGADNDWSAKTDGYARQLEQTQPALFAEPMVRFPLEASHRNRGLTRPGERYYTALRHVRAHDAWWLCAQSELWLAEPQSLPPKRVWICRKTAVKPRLDGKLDEPMWQPSEPALLRSPQRDDAQWPAVAMLCYDNEFLYLGLSCRRAPGATYKSSAAVRPRDANLDREDRVELHLDVDRDYATFYTLAVDHRGWTFDACWGDKSWNPDWFVAPRMSDDAWTIEAAIPLRHLSGRALAPKEVWAVGIERIVPGLGFQAWSEPAAPEVIPEGFGLLIFD